MASGFSARSAIRRPGTSTGARPATWGKYRCRMAWCHSSVNSADDLPYAAASTSSKVLNFQSER